MVDVGRERRFAACLQDAQPCSASAHNRGMPIALSSGPGAADWSVVCLCAGWCRTCDAYRPDLTALAARVGDARFVWLDVEDDVDWIADLDIETFPTVLVLAQRTPLFFGVMPPQIAVLERTLQALRDGPPRAATITDEQAEAAREIATRLAHWSG
jgi:thioredoxin-like negative regulator of GroEL